MNLEEELRNLGIEIDPALLPPSPLDQAQRKLKRHEISRQEFDKLLVLWSDRVIKKQGELLDTLWKALKSDPDKKMYLDYDELEKLSSKAGLYSVLGVTPRKILDARGLRTLRVWVLYLSRGYPGVFYRVEGSIENLKNSVTATKHYGQTTYKRDKTRPDLFTTDLIRESRPAQEVFTEYPKGVLKPYNKPFDDALSRLKAIRDNREDIKDLHSALLGLIKILEASAKSLRKLTPKSKAVSDAAQDLIRTFEVT